MNTLSATLATVAIAEATRILSAENKQLPDTDRVFLSKQIHRIIEANVAMMDRLSEIVNNPISTKEV